MKRKIIILISLLVVLVGCSFSGTSTAPKKVVEGLFIKYQSLDDKVLDQLDNVIASEKLTTTQKSDYEELMRKQYQNIKYNIKNEVVDGDTAVVTVEIEVYNFAKANKETETYVMGHETEFMDDKAVMSESLYEDYKISKLQNVTERTKYILDLGLTKQGNDWKLDNLSDLERQKIHGLYNV